MKSLVFGSLILVFLFSVSCSPKLVKHFHKIEITQVSKESLYPVFKSTDSSLFFNMQIDYKDNHFSGLLLVKSSEKDTYRAVFISHFGMSIFDFEFRQNNFTINYCTEILNRKQIINTLKTDFQILFLQNLTEINKTQVYQNKEFENLEINKIGGYYYLKDNQLQQLLKIEVPHFISTLRYDFTEYKNQFPQTIQIVHSRIGLNIKLKQIEK